MCRSFLMDFHILYGFIMEFIEDGMEYDLRKRCLADQPLDLDGPILFRQQKWWIMVVSCTWESKNQRMSDLERRGISFLDAFGVPHSKDSVDLDKSGQLCGLKIVIHPQKQGHETSITSKHWHVSQHATTWTIWITNMLILTVKSLTFQ